MRRVKVAVPPILYWCRNRLPLHRPLERAVAHPSGSRLRGQREAAQTGVFAHIGRGDEPFLLRVSGLHVEHPFAAAAHALLAKPAMRVQDPLDVGVDAPRAHIRRGRCVAVFHVREQGPLPVQPCQTEVGVSTWTLQHPPGARSQTNSAACSHSGSPLSCRCWATASLPCPAGIIVWLHSPPAARQPRHCPGHLRPAQARRSRHTTDRCQWSHQTGRNIICLGQSHYGHDSRAIHSYHRRAGRQRGQGQHGHRLID